MFWKDSVEMKVLFCNENEQENGEMSGKNIYIFKFQDEFSRLKVKVKCC